MQFTTVIVPVATTIIIWTLYRLLFPENILLDELLIKPLIWLLPLFILRLKINLTDKKLVPHLIFGITIGLIYSLERLFSQDHQLTLSVIPIVTSLFTAITEEVFFWGFMLAWQLKTNRSPYLQLLINNLLFVFFHLPIALFKLNYFGYDLFTYLLNIFITGFVYVILYFITRSFYTSIAAHFVWNVFSSIFR